MPEFDIFRVNHIDSGFVIAYVVLMIVRTYLQPQEVFDWYNGSYALDDSFQAKYFDFIMKILINKQLHYDGRPILRTIIFNEMRCLSYQIYITLYYNGLGAFTVDKLTTLASDALVVAILSYLVTSFVSRETWFKNQRVLWSMLRTEHTCMFSVGLLRLMANAEEFYGLNILAAIFLWFMELHFHAGSDWIEHAIYNDMGDTVRMTMTMQNFFFNI